MPTPQLATFTLGGVHPPGHKDLSCTVPIEALPLPELLTIPLLQHFGAPADSVVAAKQVVAEGDLLGAAPKGLGAPVHAPVAGTVKRVTTVPHPVLGKVRGVLLEPDPAAAPRAYAPLDWESRTPQELLARIREAGVVGMGGAGFPTHVKLSPPPDLTVDTLLINGVECESYVTADHRVMLERSADLVAGVRMLLRVLGLERKGRAVIGIENNKPDAIEAVGRAIAADPAVARDGLDMSVLPLAVKYPQGSEKQLIEAATGRRVPAGALPAHVGCVVQNVGTAVAVYEACGLGRNLTHRVVTLTGRGVARPANLLCPVGTPLSVLVEHVGGLSDAAVKVVQGGPMMGFALADLSYTVTKQSNGFLFLTREETDLSDFGPCIRCGRCLAACPMGLMPNEISIYMERERFEGTDRFGLWDCFECGSCAFVCPAKRPLVQFIRVAKLKLRQKG
jgi:electron transport complex protein RnfC